jgi:hypothetical protein
VVALLLTFKCADHTLRSTFTHSPTLSLDTVCRSGMTFLDLTVRQVEWLNTRYGVDCPLILMNSFRCACGGGGGSSGQAGARG